jgi:hypothetical protein
VGKAGAGWPQVAASGVAGDPGGAFTRATAGAENGEGRPQVAACPGVAGDPGGTFTPAMAGAEDGEGLPQVVTCAVPEAVAGPETVTRTC